MRHLSSEPDDETMVRRVLAGERRLFAVLLERRRESVLRLCRRLLGSEADAQDVAQEAALQTFLGLGGLREPGRFGAWLHSVAANLARSELRRRRRRRSSLESLQEHCGGLVDASPTPEEVRLARELHDEVLAALDGLSGVNREAVVGYYLEGHSYAELAALLGVPVSTVKGRLHKGRKQLAPALEPVAEQVLGERHEKEEMAVDENGMIEVVVDEVLKGGFDEEGYLRALKAAGSMYDLLELGMRDHKALPAAVVVLREARGERVLPIWVGLPDGLSIAASVAGREPPRPWTHDLIGQMLETLNLEVRSAAVLRLAEGVFYGEVELEGNPEAPDGGPTHRLDARPSDAIALATRAGAPIHAALAVLDEGGHESRQAFLDAHGEDLCQG